MKVLHSYNVASFALINDNVADFEKREDEVLRCNCDSEHIIGLDISILQVLLLTA